MVHFGSQRVKLSEYNIENVRRKSEWNQFVAWKDPINDWNEHSDWGKNTEHRMDWSMQEFHIELHRENRVDISCLTRMYANRNQDKKDATEHVWPIIESVNGKIDVTNHRIGFCRRNSSSNAIEFPLLFSSFFDASSIVSTKNIVHKQFIRSFRIYRTNEK